MRKSIAADALEADCPRIADGVRGVRFIEASVASSRSREKGWPLAAGGDPAKA